jgi:alpha-1,3-rhamnosyl/mannosyltransferase
MACGVPVICSNAGSLPEVAGDAALMLDCDDVDGFTDRIVDVLTNADLASEMRRKGMAQAANFSWLRTARQKLRLYTELGGA